MASTLRYKPVALLAVEFYDKDGHFTEETAAAYRKLKDSLQRSRQSHLESSLKETHKGAAKYHRGVTTHNSALRLRAHENGWQANAHMSVVRMRDSEIGFIEEKLRNNT